jgi:PHP family Zn ribbon phosphoesterase
MKIYKADLHLHTILSPCGDYGMTPTAIALKANAMGLNIIAVTDHNSAGNVLAVREAGYQLGLTVLGGMEICTEEEVHLLAYFGRDEDLFNMEDIIQKNLPGLNNPEAFGDQVFLNSRDEILGISEKLLFGATTLNIDTIVDLVHNNNGIVVASHVDRESFSIISQLGYIPEELDLDGLEQNRVIETNQGGKKLSLYGYPWITSSDAHYIEDIGKRITEFRMDQPSVTEIMLALKERDGRGVIR